MVIMYYNMDSDDGVMLVLMVEQLCVYVGEYHAIKQPTDQVKKKKKKQ